MNKFKVTGIGEILWDEFPDGKRLGGAPANFAFHAGQLGANSIVISRVGNDPPGNEIKSLLKQKNISNIIQTDPIHPTGRVSVQTDKNGSPEYVIHENSAWDFITNLAEAETLKDRTDAICYGSLAQRNSVSADSIQEYITSIDKKCLKIFDINLRQDYYTAQNISKLLNMANILKLNQDELDIISNMFLSSKNESMCLKELKSIFSLDFIILTKGEKGSRIFKNEYEESIYKSNPVKVKDSVGAGDSYTAAAAIGFLNGYSLDKINKIASSIASYVCTQKGATPTIPENILQPLMH